MDAAALHDALFRSRREEPTPLFHAEILKVMMGSDRLVDVQAFRGAAKTSLAEEAILMELVRGGASYALYIGNSLDSAIERVETLKY